MIRTLTSLLPLLLAGALGMGHPSPARANEEAAHGSAPTTGHRSPHTEHSSWLFGVKGVQLNAFRSEGESAHGGGVGVFAETTLVPGWLELELSSSVVAIESETVVPVDLLLKKPFHIGPVCPYLAIGPTVSIVFEENARVFAGGAGVVGVYIWFADFVGIDLEVDYALLAEDGLVQELTFAGGPTFRF